MNKKILLFAIVVIPLVAIGVYYWSQKVSTPVLPPPLNNVGTIETPGSKKEWSVYENLDFGFSFRYPGFLGVSSTGPNTAQQALNEGEMISGTIPPSFDTVIFSDEKGGKLFSVEIFHKLQIPLTPDMIYYQCDNQFNGGKEKIINQLRTINGISVLERKTYLSEHGIFNYFYCFQNLQGNLIVLSATSLSAQRAQEVDALLLKILETLRLVYVGR